MSAPHRPGRPWYAGGGRPDPSGDTAPIRRRPPEGYEPLHFQPETPPPPQNPVLIWVLRGLGLLAVAVISGLVWWYINDDRGTPQAPEDPVGQQSEGRFVFTPSDQVKEPRHANSCAEHAYGKVQDFFKQTPCQQLTRALYTTETADGRKVYTNVSVVRMASPEEAAALRALADQNNTGNVTDLVKAGEAKVPSLPSVAGGGYAATQHERNVIIVESALDPAARTGTKAEDEAALDAISEDAIRLGDEIGG